MQRRSKPAGFLALKPTWWPKEAKFISWNPCFFTAGLHFFFCVCKRCMTCSVCPTHLYALGSFCLIPLIVSYHIPFTLLYYRLFIDTSYPASPLHNLTYCISFNLSSFPMLIHMHHFIILVVLART